MQCRYRVYKEIWKTGFVMRNLYRKKEAGNNGYVLWILITVELLMSYSFLGYIHIEPISITFIYIPVLITGCVLGPKESTVVGAVFGLSAMWKASAFYVGAGDAVFSPFMSGKPVESILLCVGARMLFGFLSGVLYSIVKKSRHPVAGIILVTSLGRTLHTFLVYSFMAVLFPETGFRVLNTFDDFLTADYLLVMIITDIIVCICYFFRKSDHYRNFFEHIQRVDQVSSAISHYRKGLACITALFLLVSFSVTLYFSDRIGNALSGYGLELKDKAAYDLMHLEIQFLFGIISLGMLILIFVILYLKNINYLYYEARLDGLTGLMGRQQFFQEGEKLLERMDFTVKDKTGCFLILDIDFFKEINDRYGHPAGDQVLLDVAEAMRKVFEKEAILGRLGGDEFVAFVYCLMTKKEIGTYMDRLRNEIAKIEIKDQKVTCSIGVIPAEDEYSIEKLYHSADRLLYEAKKRGKNQFVYGYRFEEI